MTARQIIDMLGLSRHPEGGWYREVYRSQEQIPSQALPERYQGERCFCTSIYYLLEPGDFSAFHRVRSDEIWHVYAGTGIILHMLSLDGEYEAVRLGNRLADGEQFQVTVPAGCWFAAEPAGEGYALVGCTVAPGFAFDDFELAKADQLATAYPMHADLIRRYTRTGSA